MHPTFVAFRALTPSQRQGESFLNSVRHVSHPKPTRNTHANGLKRSTTIFLRSPAPGVTMTAMQIATFVISIVAVLAAGVSAISSQMSATAARRAVERDPWEIAHDDKGRWWLKNTTRRTAYGVTMTKPDDEPAVRLTNVPAGETIYAGARRSMSIGIGIGTGGGRSLVMITWREKACGGEQEWATEL